MSSSVAQTLSQNFAAFMGTPVGQRYADEATNLTPKRILIGCIDPRLNKVLTALGLLDDSTVSIRNAGPVVPHADDWDIDWDSAASFELFAPMPSVEEICVVPHGPGCKFCGGLTHGLPQTAENGHLVRYVQNSKLILQQPLTKLGTLKEGMEEQVALQLGLINRAHLLTYPVMQRRTDLPINIVYIGFDPLCVKLCEPGSNEYKLVAQHG